MLTQRNHNFTHFPFFILFMSSILSPVLANLFTKKHEQVLERVFPSHFFRYVDDSFAIYCNCYDNLTRYLKHQNSVYL